MIRVLFAFFWLKARLFRNAFRKSSHRGEMEQISRAAQAVGPLLLIGLTVPAMAMLGVGAFYGARFLVQPGPHHRAILIGFRGILGIVTLALFIAPLVRSMHSSGSALDRFVLLPIPRGWLLAAEMGSILADPWVLAIIPAVLIVPLGLLFEGAVAAAAPALLAGLALLLCLVAIGTFIVTWLNLALRDRRRGEILVLVVMALFTLAAFLPMILSSPRETERKVLLVNPHLRRLVKVFPSEMYVRVLEAGTAGRVTQAAGALGGLVAAGAGFSGLSWLAFRRLLETPPGGRSRRGTTRRPLRIRRFPGLSPAASAVAAATARLALRTVRGKTAIFFTPATVAILGIVGQQISVRGEGGFVPFQGLGLAIFGSAVTLLSLQPFQLNQFAGDRAGLTLQFLVPLSDRDLVRGKAAGVALLWAITQVLCLAAAAVTSPGGNPLMWLAAALAGLATLAGMTPAAAALSAVFPKPADPGKLGSAGNPHGAASLLGGLAAFLLFAIPLVPALLVNIFLHRPGVAMAITAGWTLLMLACSGFLLGPAAAVLARRRENLALVAQGR